MNDEDYNFNVAALRQALVDMAAKYPMVDGFAYTSAADFLVQHGVDYRPGHAWLHYPRGTQLQCFGNAIKLAAQYGLRYCEGVALSPKGEVIAHGWNLDDKGLLVDSTWCKTGLVYIGVEFSLERADDATWNGDASVLADEHRGFPLFRQRWTGEDPAIVWPYSDRIEAYHRWRTTGEYHPPASALAYLKERREHSIRAAQRSHHDR